MSHWDYNRLVSKKSDQQIRWTKHWQYSVSPSLQRVPVLARQRLNIRDDGQLPPWGLCTTIISGFGLGLKLCLCVWGCGGEGVIGVEDDAVRASVVYCRSGQVKMLLRYFWNIIYTLNCVLVMLNAWVLNPYTSIQTKVIEYYITLVMANCTTSWITFWKHTILIIIVIWRACPALIACVTMELWLWWRLICYKMYVKSQLIQ